MSAAIKMLLIFSFHPVHLHKNCHKTGSVVLYDIAALHNPTPWFSFFFFFQSWRFLGEVLWVGPSCLMYYPVPYILSPLFSCRGHEDGRQCCQVRMLLRITLRQVTLNWFCTSLHHLGRPSVRLDHPVLNISHCRSTLQKWACAEEVGSTWKPDWPESSFS